MPRKKKYTVTLSDDERKALRALISSGEAKARTLTHARMWLKADEGWTDQAISEALDVSTATVGRVRKRYAEEGLEATLHRRRPRRTYMRKLDGRAEAHLIALACSAPPEGHARWSFRGG